MADKPPPPNDQNILVYVPEYQNVSLQATVNSRKQVYYRGYESPRSDSVRSEAAESTCSSLSSTDTLVDIEQSDFKQETIAPPLGWKRLLTNGVIVYVSPSNTALSSIEQVKAYLLSEGTCKCGLECPFNFDATFNFNSKVLTRLWTSPLIGPGDSTKLCNHKRKSLTHGSIANIDNRYDALRKKKRKIVTHQPSVSQLLIQRERGEHLIKEQQAFNGLPWRENLNNQFVKSGPYTNGYQQDDTGMRYQPPELQRLQDAVHRFPAQVASSTNQPTSLTTQGHYEHRPYPVQAYDAKYNKRIEYPPTQENVRAATPSSVAGNRSTPPWQQNKLQVYERVPPLHQPPAPVWAADLKKKQQTPKIVQRKRFSDESPSLDPGSILPDQPSFMDDPSGYLAQQTALLNSTISRQNASCPPVDNSGNGGIPLAANINRYVARPKSRNTPIPAPSRFPDSSFERRKVEEPSSSDSDKGIDDRGPIQGATVSTSNRSPGEASPDTVTTVVTTMASGHTASSNTITSVLAGRTNTATVTVNNQQTAGKQELQINIQPELIKPAGHILVSSNGQLIVANSMLSPQQQNIQKTATSPGSAGSQGQIGVTSQVLNQPTVLVNTLPGPLLLQPSVVVDGTLNTVQLPQIVGVQNQLIDENQVLSPDSKRKAAYKKRKLSPTVSSMLLSPQSTNSVVVQPQQLNTPMVQALTILPSKANFAGSQQLITTNMLQPLNLVQNFPIQQFIVPAGVSGMVMSDGTILQDAVQLNLLTPVQNTNVFNGQNLLAPGMVIRTPVTSQSANKVLQNNQFLNSPNHYLVNNTFSGQLSPMLSVSPNRNQDFIPQNVVVQQQPNTSNTTVVQQNTTIVQQTTMVSNQQTQPTPTLNLNQNFILNDKPNFILTSEKQNFILSPNSGDKILISPENVRGNFVVSNIDKQNFVINNVEKQNLVVNNFDKNFIIDKKSTVSTQTQSQLVAANRGSTGGSGGGNGGGGGGLMIGTSSEHSTAVYAEIAADTTTLSPVDHEVTTSLHTPPTSSPNSDPTTSALPMVHCVSSSSHLDDTITIDNYNGNMNKPASYTESTSLTLHAGQGKNNDYSSKSLCNVPDSLHITNGGSEIHIKEEIN